MAFGQGLGLVPWAIAPCWQYRTPCWWEIVTWSKSYRVVWGWPGGSGLRCRAWWWPASVLSTLMGRWADYRWFRWILLTCWHTYGILRSSGLHVTILWSRLSTQEWTASRTDSHWAWMNSCSSTIDGFSWEGKATSSTLYPQDWNRKPQNKSYNTR